METVVFYPLTLNFILPLNLPLKFTRITIGALFGSPQLLNLDYNLPGTQYTETDLYQTNQSKTFPIIFIFVSSFFTFCFLIPPICMILNLSFRPPTKTLSFTSIFQSFPAQTYPQLFTLLHATLPYSSPNPTTDTVCPIHV